MTRDAALQKKFLVAGGSGLIGANLVKKLEALGADAIATFLTRAPANPEKKWKRADLTSAESCLEITKGVDYAILCAGRTFGAQAAQKTAGSDLLTNISVNINLLDACRANKVKRVLFISSSAVYQEAAHPIREDELDLNKPPHEAYGTVGRMNRFIEQLCLFYHQHYGISIDIVRAAHVYGPGDNFDPQTSRVIPALIRRALNKERPFVVWGEDMVVRDFIYVDDFVDDLLKVINDAHAGDAVNIGSGAPTTIRQAAETILHVCEHDAAIKFDPDKPTTIPYRMLDISRFNKRFGTPKRTPLKEGVRKTVEWYKEHGLPREKQVSPTCP